MRRRRHAWVVAFIGYGVTALVLTGVLQTAADIPATVTLSALALLGVALAMATFPED